MLKYHTSSQCAEWQQSAGFLHCFAKLLPSTTCSAPSLGLTIILTAGQKCDGCLTLKCKSLLLPVPQGLPRAAPRVAQPKPACPHAMDDCHPSRAAWEKLCHCPVTLSAAVTGLCVTGLTSCPLFYSSQLVWHSTHPPHAPVPQQRRQLAVLSPTAVTQSHASGITVLESSVQIQEWGTRAQLSHVCKTSPYKSEYRQAVPFKTKTAFSLNSHCFLSSQMCPSKMQRAYTPFIIIHKTKLKSAPAQMISKFHSNI